MYYNLFNLFVILLFPFLFLGLLGKFKAFWSGKIGPSVLQPFYEFNRLLKKDQVISSTTSFIFKITPVISLSTVVFASLIVPLSGNISFFNFSANYVVFCFILALGRFFMIISALDTGSSFEGMGANRESIFSAFVEPALFILISSFLLLNNNMLNFSDLINTIKIDNTVSIVIQTLTVIILLVIILIEGCRIPVDDPKTHLELTMIHEVMILDNSGIDLAIITYTSGLKIILFSSIISNILIPDSLPFCINILAFSSLTVIIAFCVATIESTIARFRISHVPQFLFLMISLALIILSLIILYLSGGFNG